MSVGIQLQHWGWQSWVSTAHQQVHDWQWNCQSYTGWCVVAALWLDAWLKLSRTQIPDQNHVFGCGRFGCSSTSAGYMLLIALLHNTFRPNLGQLRYLPAAQGLLGCGYLVKNLCLGSPSAMANSVGKLRRGNRTKYVQTPLGRQFHKSLKLNHTKSLMGHAQDMGFWAQIQLANPTHVQQHMRAHTHTQE